ncbi:Prenylated rab acceptor PRA1 [Macleaya cordata]|uniref:PRA1 family protein n=1 Tax=Macleaya cordata TaxID=56857 RepID=A0A200QLR4_MACCD|nr:Prenylated rab acceptor PRA1 [Macleaya cordata]
MTNTYGTIPTSTTGASSNLEFISRAKDRLKSGLGTRRPWNQMIHLQSLGFPSGFGGAISRIKTNTAYFRMNYAIIVLLILFLSLLWHPISLIVFVILMAAWLFLYFLRDEPLVIFNRTINDRVVLIVLSAVTIVGLLLTGAPWNIVGAILVGVVVVLVHAVVRKTDDLFVDEEEAFGLAAQKRPFYEPSASYSS